MEAHRLSNHTVESAAALAPHRVQRASDVARVDKRPRAARRGLEENVVEVHPRRASKVREYRLSERAACLLVEVLVVPPRWPRGPRALDARGEGVGGAARAAEARPRVGRVVARESARAGRARSVRLAKRVPAADERNRLCVVHGHARKGPSHVGRRPDRVRHLEAGFEAVSGGIRGGVGGAASREGQRVRRGSVSMTAPS